MYVSDIIGDDFTKWRDFFGTVFIQTPTQSGKTTFFFHFLDWYLKQCKNDDKVLFLVSRKALLKKIEEDLRCFAAMHYFDVIKIFTHVEISTYQSIEHRLINGSKWYDSFDYIFCDEAHYFLSDSSFNSNTFASYRWILNAAGLKIFMSATLENVKHCIVRDTGLKRYDPNQKYHTNLEYMDYAIASDYSQYEISYFADEKSIPKLIGFHAKQKWGIFVTNRKKGEQLKNELDSLGYAVSFLDADFANDQSALTEMNNIVTKEYFDKQVLIATPVLDTGINLWDRAFTNIIVMANTLETFIQMIGRKRRLSKHEKIRLFIPCRSVNYFDTLARTMSESRIKPLEEMIRSPLSADQLLADPFNSVDFNIIQNCCFMDNEIFALNPLSVTQLFYEYGEVIDNLKGMKKDGFYFVKKQLSWLGLDESHFSEKNLVEYKICRNVREEVSKILEENAGKIYEKSDFSKILSDCENLISQVQPKMVKSGRAFTFGKLNEFCKNEKIPFEIKSKGGNKAPGESKTFTTYWILRLEDLE